MNFTARASPKKKYLSVHVRGGILISMDKNMLTEIPVSEDWPLNKIPLMQMKNRYASIIQTLEVRKILFSRWKYSWNNRITGCFLSHRRKLWNRRKLNYLNLNFRIITLLPNLYWMWRRRNFVPLKRISRKFKFRNLTV